MIISIFGGGSAKRAAKEQAAAIRAQTAATVRQAGLAAEAAASQMRNTLLTEQATDYARSLLGRPIESVDVRLAPTETSTGDVTRRNRNERERYHTTWFG